MRDTFLVLLMVWLTQAVQRGTLGWTVPSRYYQELCFSISYLFFNHACFRKFIVKESSAIIILFDGCRIVNRCKPGIATPFNALVSCNVPFFVEILNKLESQGPEKVQFLDLKTKKNLCNCNLWKLEIPIRSTKNEIVQASFFWS